MEDASQALLARARAGDAAALEALLESIAPAVHRFGMRMCKDRADADDALQDTLLAIATHLGEFEGRSSLLSWVFALTRSACARRRRGLKNQKMASEDAAPEPLDESPSPEARAADHELSAVLTHALDDLPEDYREIIVLRDIEGLTAPDAAATLGVSVDTVKSRLHRAREALRVALRPILEQNAPPPGAGCPDVVAMWSKKLEGDLSQRDCAAMEGHIVTCPSCGTACDALKEALLACRRTSAASVPPEVQARVRAAVRAFSARTV